MIQNFKNKKILIVGGTGSFGKAMVEKILNSKLNFFQKLEFLVETKKNKTT